MMKTYYVCTIRGNVHNLFDYVETVVVVNIDVFGCSVKPQFGNYNPDVKPPTSMNSESVSPAWQGRSIAGPKLRLVEFSAFLEQTRDPDTVSR